jgi:hypothetical protein
MEDVCIFYVHVVYFTAKWCTYIFYGHLGHFVIVWYILSRFGMLYREKSGNPVWYYMRSLAEFHISEWKDADQ